MTDGTPEQLGIPWSETVPTHRYVALLETYSAHAALPIRSGSTC